MNRKEVAAAQLEILRAWRAVFFDDKGALSEASALVLRDIEAEFHQTRSTASVDKDGRIDPLAMAMNEGKRAAFMFIKRRLYTDPAPLMRATEEAE